MEPERKAPFQLSEAKRALLRRYLSGAAGTSPAPQPTSIPKRTESGPAPLSYSQQQIWLHSQLAGDALIYNEPITIHRYGELDRRALAQSFLEIVRRHEAWRTTFEWKGDQPVQIVQPAPSDIEIPFVDLRETAAGEREPEAIRLATADALQPFDLAKGPMYRMRLVRLSDSEHRLFITLHHIIFDGVSLYRVLLPELQMLYEASARSESVSLAPLPIQYPDYAVWQRSSLKEISAEHLSFWQRICHDLPVLDLSTDHPRPPSQTYAGAMETFHIPASTAAALRILSHEQGATPFMTMTTAFMALLHGYTGQEDIAIGGVSSGRHHKETMNLLGCFLNTVVIRCGFSADLPFTEMLNRVRSATLEALSHDEVPFEMLVQQFATQRDASRAPLVQALIVVEPPLDPLKEGWAFTHMDVETGTAKFDLQLGLDDRAEGLTGRFTYNTDLFERRTIELLKSRWLKLLDLIARAPTQRINEFKSEVWREAAETDRELRMPPPEWNGTAAKYPREATIDQVFEDQARQTPSAIAVIFGEERITCDDLNRRANRLARRLRKLGVSRDLPVGICMERSTEMIVALLAVLKAGGVYVPLDPTYPVERRTFMMADTGMQVILTDTENRHAGSATKHSLCVQTESLDGFDDSNLAEERRAEDLCYIMYTSGSTGAPKGVAVTHRGVVRLVKGTNYASFSGETFLQLAPISFDASTFEIWGPLLNGGTLVVMPPAPPSLQEIGGAIREKGVTTLWLTAGLFNAMLDERPQDLRPLHQLLAGGDVLSISHVGKALRELRETRLINGYGPTESTTFACCHAISESDLGESIPIGKPIANTTAYILDAQLRPLPIGKTGELFIGGDGVARGYWASPELTAEKFIDDPFSPEPRAKLYRTGDLARWRKDGVIEFLGRADMQVKLRGFRIELAEIENALRAQPSVLDSAVVLREDIPGHKQLVGYVVCPPNAASEETPVQLVAALKKSLPEYMVPSAIVALPALPRTTNDKVDRRALPPPRAAEKSRNNFVEPNTPFEKKIAAIWEDLLGLERVGLADNFFDLGGHSLLGLRLVNQLRDMLGQNVAFTLIFEAPTLGEMTKMLEKSHSGAEKGTAASTPLVPVNREARRKRRS